MTQIEPEVARKFMSDFLKGNTDFEEIFADEQDLALLPKMVPHISNFAWLSNLEHDCPNTLFGAKKLFRQRMSEILANVPANMDGYIMLLTWEYGWDNPVPESSTGMTMLHKKKRAASNSILPGLDNLWRLQEVLGQTWTEDAPVRGASTEYEVKQFMRRLIDDASLDNIITVLNGTSEHQLDEGIFEYAQKKVSALIATLPPESDS